MRRRALNAPIGEAAEGDEQSYQGEFPPAPPRRRRARGRPRAAAAQEIEQEQPLVEQKASEVNQ